ncbi:hypothetical protein QQP08_000956 [Theobroma cacao]|nr:hypothetical protein QQP08_000956 [Theobroma cacao]
MTEPDEGSAASQGFKDACWIVCRRCYPHGWLVSILFVDFFPGYATTSLEEQTTFEICTEVLNSIKAVMPRW